MEMDMSKVNLKPTTAMFPLPVMLITCVDTSRKPNIITLAWVGVVNSSPPMISISIRPGRYSHRLVKASQEFVLNIPSEEIIREVDLCGVVSGRDVDKFSETGFTPIQAQEVSPPLIQECPVNVECKVRRIISLGSHDLFLGEIVAIHIDDTVLKEKGRIDIVKALPVAYCAGSHEYWSLGKMLGWYGFTKGKLHKVEEQGR
jgi:flavin reductase (DIM6/NTAB) family NADH-FMN oxidoreductase RutF